MSCGGQQCSFSITPIHALHLIRFALEELGLPYESRQLSLAKGEHKTGAYLALNPIAQLSTLIDGHLTIREAAAIVLHLGDKAQELLAGFETLEQLMAKGDSDSSEPSELAMFTRATDAERALMAQVVLPLHAPNPDRNRVSPARHRALGVRAPFGAGTPCRAEADELEAAVSILKAHPSEPAPPAILESIRALLDRGLYRVFRRMTATAASA